MTSNKIVNFKTACSNAFDFLIKDYGFRYVHSKKDRFEVDMTYKNKTTGIIVHYDFRENQIFISLHKLINREIYDDDITGKLNKKYDNNFDLDDLLALRSPKPRIGQKNDFSKNYKKSCLFEYGKDLRKYAEDILKGDFSIFEQLSEIKKMRAKRRFDFYEKKH